jgi:hypothetical protein
MKAAAAWAIRIQHESGPTLAGVYFFGTPRWFSDGCRSALFRTRREAREAMASRFCDAFSRQTYAPRVVRVRIHLEVL